MINIYARIAPDATLARDERIVANDPRAIWIDLDRPSAQEESAIELALGIDVPTHAERAAFEESARFYEENGALVMTATLLGRRDEGPFVTDAVMFVLVAGKLVTVREISPRAFDIGEGRAAARVQCAETGADVFVALIASIVERIADRISEATREANTLSADVFAEVGATANLRASMRALGRIGTLTAQASDSIAGMAQLVTYAAAKGAAHGLNTAALEENRRDLRELERAATALQNRLVFLLDAAVGLANANQSEILKALSVATIAFVPPTLIASIFGMNFEHMSWFAAPWGPWVGFALMLAAPAALFALAKWRNWF